jgi:hypothetical protein
VRVYDFSEYELQVLRRASRGRGVSAVGAVTIDAQWLCGGVRADLRGMARAALDALVRKGLIRQVPKPGNPVYTVTPGIGAILESLDSQWAQSKKRPTADELGADPNLLEGIVGTIRGERYVTLVSYEASKEEDVPDVDSGKTYKKLDLVLEVTCPKTTEKWFRKITLGIMDQHLLQSVPCVLCDKYHTFRGVKFLPPKH